VDASDKRNVGSLPKFLAWTLGRAVLRCAASGSGLHGCVLPPGEAIKAVDATFPPVSWWRLEVRRGTADAEAFANGVRPPAREPDAAPPPPRADTPPAIGA
jgi:hypothetical protein